MSRVLLLLLAGWLAASCTPSNYAVRTLDASALTAHRTVAILPFEVTQDRFRMRDLRYLGSDTTLATQQRVQQDWTAQQQAESQALAYELQQLLYAELQKQRPAAGYTVQLQPVPETNRRLQAAGISYANLPERSMSELQQALGVDAILSGQTDLYQPLPGGLALAARLLLNEPLLATDSPSSIPFSQATTNLTVHDCRSGQLTWRFDYDRTGSAALKPAKLAADLVRRSASDFPYRRLK
ncbi:hypothetical protein GCM10027346_20320 [Hymenobacter seoulensis]